MATDDNEQNPFTRPGFIAAAVVVVLVVVLGLVIAIVNATRSDDPEPTPEPSPTTSTAPTSDPSDVAGGASVCGLEGEELAGTLSTAPAADWAYQGTTAYPTSPEFGPGETSADGVRFCFQHSPTGALFMAANALVQGSDPAASQAWIEYALADGPYREELIGQVGDTSGSESTRMSLAGFRMLAYDGDTARVDLAVRASSEGQNLTLSGVYELVWQDGDWKISADVAQPLNTATVPDLAGYITWGE